MVRRGPAPGGRPEGRRARGAERDRYTHTPFSPLPHDHTRLFIEKPATPHVKRAGPRKPLTSSGRRRGDGPKLTPLDGAPFHRPCNRYPKPTMACRFGVVGGG